MTTINVFAPGHLDMADSYGLIAVQLIRHLAGLGLYVNALARGERNHASQPPDVAAITQQPIRASFGGFLLGYPDKYHEHGNLALYGPRVAVTMWESTACPQSWIEPLNQCAAVITPSRFCQQVFRECGVTVPIHVIPLGVNDVYRPLHRPTGRSLTFLAFLDRGRRKGGLFALQAFIRAFEEDSNYRLILKRRQVGEGRGITIINTNVDVIQQDMSEAELYDLYARCDVLINPHKGEGFGIIPREFSATGGISLTTDWSGTTDDLSLYGIPIPYTLTRADWTGHKKLEGLELGAWAEPDMEALVSILKRVAENRTYYQARARRNAPLVAAKYSWRAFAEGVLSVWRSVTERERQAA